MPPKRRAEEVSSAEKRVRSEKGNLEFELGRNRRVSVGAFKGMVLVDIRESYEAADGSLRPGKKGISLTVDQWEALKSHVRTRSLA